MSENPYGKFVAIYCGMAWIVASQMVTGIEASWTGVIILLSSTGVASILWAMWERRQR